MPRPLTEADLEAAASLINEATPESPVDEAELGRWLTSPSRDIEFALFERGGELVAYADVGLPEETPDRGWLDMRIPARFLEDELLDEVLEWSERTARARGRRLLRAPVTAGSAAAAQLERRGYRTIRHSFQMRIELDGPLPAPEWPVGLTVASLRPGEERLAREVAQEAFADHWEFTPSPWEDWAHFMIDDGFDPELWLLARDGDEVAGVCLSRTEAIGRPGIGYVRTLGVRRSWRRRGLGRALLLETFRRFRERGARAVALGVDGENTTGAVHLYESVGMHVEHRDDLYERSLG